MINKSGTGMIRRLTNLRLAGIAVILGIPACGSDGSHGTTPGAYPGSFSTYQMDAGTGGASAHGSDPFANAGEPSGSAGSFGAGGPHSSLWGISDPPDAGSERPFTKPFTGLVSQDVPWAGASVKIVGARIERGSDPKAVSASDVYAELDVAITNNAPSEWDVSDRNTWDLMLATGDRIRSENAVGVLISPTDTAKTTLRYLVTESTTLAGAFLELNGDQRGDVEPERIPLDTKWLRKYPLEISSLAGMKVAAQTIGNSSLELLIRHAAVDLNDVTGRAPVGDRFVHLDMRGTAGAQWETIVNNDFRIVVDGASYAPVNDVNANPQAHASVDFEVLFTVPAATTKFDILLTPGDTSTRFSVDLAKDAHLEGPGGTDAMPDAGQ
jgi:hypothetical protein